MKKSKHIFCFSIVITCVIIIASGCSKKYPGDDVSYCGISPLKRLSDHYYGWGIDNYIEDGSDSTKLITWGTSCAPRGLEITGKTKTGINFNGRYYTTICTGSMNFIDNENKLNIQLTSFSQGCYNPFVNMNTNWDIEELTMNTLKIRSTINGITYEIYFSAS
ncbi:MAG: hypothetical protein JST67_07430 [Bacteroidetes bacterium]|nr:hypothetical protein [Bacteroidota bacterium]